MRNLLCLAAGLLIAGSAFGQANGNGYGPVLQDVTAATNALFDDIVGSYNVYSTSNDFTADGQFFDVIICDSVYEDYDGMGYRINVGDGVLTQGGSGGIWESVGTATTGNQIVNYTTMSTAFRLAPIAAPAVTNEGSMYYDSGANKLKFWNGSAWETITSAP